MSDRPRTDVENRTQEGGAVRGSAGPAAADGRINADNGGRRSTHWLAPVLVALIGAFMAILDTSIVNVAIPTMMNVFGVDTVAVQWVATAYLLALGVVVPFSGWLGDRLGFKNLYILSMAVFVLGSLLCAAAPSLEFLIAARIVQAVGGGMIMPTTMAMVYRLVPRDRIGRAMGIFGIALLVAPALGPTLGGYLVEYVDWRWIFTINLPVGVVGILLSWSFLPDFSTTHPGRLDIGGSLTSSVALFSLLLALSKGADWGWGAEPTVLLLFTSAVSFVLFIYIELTAERPLLELRVFKYPSFMWANLLIVVSTVGMYAGLFYLPLFLQNIRGLGALETGLLLMPGALVSGMMMPIIGRLFDKIGPRPLVVTGVLLLAVTTYLFHNLSVVTATSTVVVWVMMRGVVMPLANMPAQTAALADIPDALVGRASAVTNIIGRVSGSFGIAVLTSILSTRQAIHRAGITWSIDSTSPEVSGTVAQISAALGGGTRGQGGAVAYLNGMVLQNSYVNAIDDVFLITAVFTLLALIPAFFLKRGSGSNRGPAAAAGE
ncbi:DHA2 family efflux MFS transporter permease subunit [Salinispira pacifica]